MYNLSTQAVVHVNVGRDWPRRFSKTTLSLPCGAVVQRNKRLIYIKRQCCTMSQAACFLAISCQTSQAQPTDCRKSRRNRCHGRTAGAFPIHRRHPWNRRRKCEVVLTKHKGNPKSKRFPRNETRTGQRAEIFPLKQGTCFGQ